MLNSIIRILEKTDNINRSTYFWNAVSAMILALQSPVLVAVITRTNGAADAGVFSIAIAVANLMLFLGQYGLRRYQSSDIRQEFSFGEYHALRLITCGAMAVICLLYCLYGLMFRDYSISKFLIVYIICMIKTVQAYADVLHGHLQQRGRLDIATKASSFRYAAELVIYIAVLIITRDLLLSVVICLAATVLIMLVTSYNAASRYTDSMKPEISREKFRLLMIEGFPLFISMFLNMYIGNAPKYAIDACLTDHIQAVYNMIFMPTYVVQMVTQFIFNPVLTVYAELWISHSRERFERLRRMINRMYLTVLALAVLAVAAAATIGIPVLSAVFGLDLSEYRKELCIIMIAGGFLGYSIYFSTLIAVIRAQKPLIVCYGIVAVLAKAFSGSFVRNYGLMGAAVLNAALMILLAASLFIVTTWALRRERRRIYAGEYESRGSSEQ